MPNWKKTKRLRWHEVRVRSAQKIAALKERSGLSSLTRLPSKGEFAALLDPKLILDPDSYANHLFEHFRLRSSPSFFSGLEGDQSPIVTNLRSRWPAAEVEIVARAERNLQGRFDLLGFRDLSFGNPINWHFEPLTKKSAPLRHWSQLDYLDAEIAGDKKVIWELNRHQYFTTLGQAYWLTGDEKYAETFVSHIESWMDQNTPKIGINWASSLEVSFRSIAWLWAFYFFRKSNSLTASSWVRVLKYLYLNARHLETYLSTYFSPNTHLTGEALGLFYLGTLLPEFQAARRWRELGEQILLAQLPIHVRPDGVYFEQSSYYHRYTTDFYLHFLILSQSNGYVLPDLVADRLQALLDHLMFITRPDGTTPLFGDDDGGRLIMLDRRPANDFRATLSTGAALFERSDYKFVSGGVAEETLWLLGGPALQRLDQIVEREPARQSIAFESAGYYVMRDGWTSNSNFLLFDCGPHGHDNCGHAHADALAVELVANGRTMLVDPGTYTYTGAKEIRDYFRSSAAHNTLTVGGRSSSVPAGPFSWKSVAHGKAKKWISDDRFDYVAGNHSGYSTSIERVQHDRSVLFLKQDYWVVCDHLNSAEARVVDIFFHFPAEANPLIEADTDKSAFIADSSEDAGLDLHTFVENGQWRREEGWVSECYGHREPGRVYVCSARMNDANRAITFLLPLSANSRWSAREVEAVGGRAFEISNEEWVDLVMIRSGDKIETARLASDFEWTWARFTHGAASALEEFVAIDGRSLLLDGIEICSFEKSISHIAGKFAGDKFELTRKGGSASLGLETGLSPFTTPGS